MGHAISGKHQYVGGRAEFARLLRACRTSFRKRSRSDQLTTCATQVPARQGRRVAVPMVRINGLPEKTGTDCKNVRAEQKDGNHASGSLM